MPSQFLTLQFSSDNSLFAWKEVASVLTGQHVRWQQISNEDNNSARPVSLLCEIFSSLVIYMYWRCHRRKADQTLIILLSDGVSKPVQRCKFQRMWLFCGAHNKYFDFSFLFSIVTWIYVVLLVRSGWNPFFKKLSKLTYGWRQHIYSNDID